MIEYETPSSSVAGTRNKGFMYIRGTKGETSDQFKFVIEKHNDFHDFDIDIILTAYEEAFKPKPRPLKVGADS